MLILAIFLSWLPALGPLAAGFVGGFGALVIVAVQERPLLLGAWFGGATHSGSPQTA